MAGYGPTARNPQAALPGCPALRKLCVTASSEGRQAADREAVVEPDLFGDAFYESLATHCRRLKQVQISVDSPIETFTDRALCALATLPLLTCVRLYAVNITGDGVVELAWGGARQPKREYEVLLGDEKKPSRSLVFYNIVIQALTRLANWGLDGCSDCQAPGVAESVVLQLLNMGYGGMDRGSENYLARLQVLVEAVKTLHPELRLHIEVMKPSFGGENSTVLVSFEGIAKVVLYTASAPGPRHWSASGMMRIDDVFGYRCTRAYLIDESDEDDDATVVDDAPVPNDGYASESDENGDYSEAHIMDVWSPSYRI